MAISEYMQETELSFEPSRAPLCQSSAYIDEKLRICIRFCLQGQSLANSNVIALMCMVSLVSGRVRRSCVILAHIATPDAGTCLFGGVSYSEPVHARRERVAT